MKRISIRAWSITRCAIAIAVLCETNAWSSEFVSFRYQLADHHTALSEALNDPRQEYLVLPRPFTATHEQLLADIRAAHTSGPSHNLLDASQAEVLRFRAAYWNWLGRALAAIEGHALELSVLEHIANTQDGAHEDGGVFSIIAASDPNAPATRVYHRGTDRWTQPNPGSLIVMNGMARGFTAGVAPAERRFRGGTHEKPAGIVRPVIRAQLHYLPRERERRYQQPRSR